MTSASYCLFCCCCQFLMELQGERNIALALAMDWAQCMSNTQAVAMQLPSQLQEVVSTPDMQAQEQQVHTLHMLAGQQQQLMWHAISQPAAQSQWMSLVLILTHQLATAKQQQAASIQVQQQLQQEILQLKRSLAAAQQRKQAAESKLKAVQQEGSALAVALRTMANMLVDKSEQKAGLQCNAELVHHPQSSTGSLLQQCTTGQLLLGQDQQPVTPSGDCVSSRPLTQLQRPAMIAVPDVAALPVISENAQAFGMVSSFGWLASCIPAQDFFCRSLWSHPVVGTALHAESER